MSILVSILVSMCFISCKIAINCTEGRYSAKHLVVYIEGVLAWKLSESGSLINST